jgi:hypothetical protein
MGNGRVNAPARREETPWEFDFWTPEPWWKGEQAFVLASGPSLSQEICDKIKGRKAIVINVSFKLAPWAPVWFFTDSSIYERYRDEIAAWPGEVITMSRTAKRELDKRVKRIKGEGDPTLPIPLHGFPSLCHPCIRQGRSSGHTAISLAVALGATQIQMLGFDMRFVEGREHHHQEYTGPRDLELYERDFVPGFEGWNAAALKAGVRILNCTPGSAVNEFPFADLDEVLSCDPSRR